MPEELSNSSIASSPHVAVWLVRLRWALIVFYGAAGYLGFKHVYFQSTFAISYFGCLAFLTVFNLYSLEKIKQGNGEEEVYIFGQAFIDTLCLFFLLMMTGGIRNPMVPIVFVQLTVAALLMSSRLRNRFLFIIPVGFLGLYLSRDWQTISADFYVWQILPSIIAVISAVLCFVAIGFLSESLKKTKVELESATRRKNRTDNLLALGALSAEFAHRLATPLNTLKLRVARLKRRSEVAPHLSFEIEQIGATVDQAENVLREHTSMSLDTSLLKNEPVEMKSFLRDVVHDWGFTHSDKKLQLQDSVLSNPTCVVPKAILKKSIFNLLDNAHENAPNAEIEVSVEESSNKVVINVMDRGPGWPDEIMRLGIRPHFSKRPGGTGLGLFNCLSLCEALGGSLELLEREKGGAIARLSLPR